MSTRVSVVSEHLAQLLESLTVLWKKNAFICKKGDFLRKCLLTNNADLFFLQQIKEGGTLGEPIWRCPLADLATEQAAFLDL